MRVVLGAVGDSACGSGAKGAAGPHSVRDVREEPLRLPKLGAAVDAVPAGEGLATLGAGPVDVGLGVPEQRPLANEAGDVGSLGAGGAPANSGAAGRG